PPPLPASHLRRRRRARERERGRPGRRKRKMMMPTGGESRSPVRALRRLAGSLLAAARLRGSFSASKCKTEARMAAARMKLLRNRREAQVRKMRGDVAALLRDGREDTARIRVEHVIREQNTMAANEIIELFCELIVTRLPIIAKQKECPADLKEGICSLIFAAPRCSELPELTRMRDLFEKKYGKDFVAAAVDLRPNAGVNNLLIEKLSVNKPSGQTKLKVLKDIAKEHQIDWDPSEAEQDLLKPAEELIQGPSSFGEASKMPVKTTLSANFVQPTPSNYSSGYADEYDDNHVGGAMQFKDAASAARAAAESAAQAASAAKAAASLANQNAHSSDEDDDDDEDWKTTLHESTHSSRRQSMMSNSSRTSRKENASTFDEMRLRGSTGRRLSGSNHMEDKDSDLLQDLGTGRTRRRNSRAASKVHSEIKFDDSEAEDGSDAEIQSSLERRPPRKERYPGNGHHEEKEVEDDDDDFPEPPKANPGSCVHPNMPLDFETLTARFEALRSSGGKLP
uniref:IST1-like protein n=1 Tax=Aegilops tauschii subsp. strangulata TaxID=200361 RepID=A0A453LJD8_AEGTS